MTSLDTFSLTMKVRDYECDMQGIVNNAVYLNYLEHVRHEFLESMGLSFKKLLDQGIYLVAIQAEQTYKRPLYFGDSFMVTCNAFSESKFKMRFGSEIHNESRDLVLVASTIVAAIDEARKPILISSFYPI